MKPIETVYNGYRFRSRLEARWAVFFDTLGVEYEYEKEGFDLGKSGKYLPDFYLPRLDCWFEVKGKEITSDEQNKARQLRDQTDKPVIISVGSFDRMYTPTCYLYAYDLSDSSGGEYENEGYFEIKDNSLVFVISEDGRFARGDRHIYATSMFGDSLKWVRPKGLLDTIEWYEGNDGFGNDPLIYSDIANFQNAVYKARSARFEFNR